MKPHDNQFEDVTRLLRLKRYEQPDADFDARNMAAIRARLAALPERPTWAQRLWGLFEQTPAPALRYAMATAVVALVGLNVLTLSLLPERDAVALLTNDSPVVAQVEERVQPAQTNLAPEPYAKPVFVFEYPASNRSSQGGMQYGTGPVMPVRYDY